MTTARSIKYEDPGYVFEDERDALFDQFQNVEYRKSTGLGSEELRAIVHECIEENANLPRVLQKAHSFRIIAENCRLHIDPHTWFVGDFGHYRILPELREQWLAEVEAGPLNAEARWFDLAFETGTLRGKLDFHHVAPGWENLFDGGLEGLIERVEASRVHLGEAATASQLSFLDAVEIVCRASIQLADRFSEYARNLAESLPDRANRLNVIAEIVSRVPKRGPESFHEALQAIWFFQCLVEFEGESTMSLGHFDRMLYPYYRNDVESGSIDKDRAKELIKYFWFKYHARRRGEGDSARNFTLAGQNSDGTDASNELTYLMLDACEELNTPDPKLSIRIFSGTSDELLHRIATLIRGGCNSIVLMNDEPSIAGLMKAGKTVEDARCYLSIGCYEPAIDGKDMACTMNIPVNLAKGIELLLNRGVDPLTGVKIGIDTGDPKLFSGYDEVQRAYCRQMDHLLETARRYLTNYEEFWEETNPSPLLAATLDDCIARGLDIGQGGCIYNSVGCPAGALAEVADSLMALKRAVFDEKRFSMVEMIEAIGRNFAGYEPMRQYLTHGVPKWGNNIESVDTIAREIADHYCDFVGAMRTSRGGPYQPGLFALHFQWTYGQKTGALPSGRLSGSPTAPGISAALGMDTDGITSVMRSLTKLDYSKAPDGSVLDVMLHPSAVAGPDGIGNITSLVKTHFGNAGNYLQFNVVDTDTLEDARKHPERHTTLQVRVTGYSAYFTQLSDYEQQLFIDRVKHVTGPKLGDS